MSLLKQIDDKGATIAWSPVRQQGNLVALGTRDGGGASFDDYGGELEIHKLDFATKDTKTKLIGTVRTTSRFVSLAWSAHAKGRAEFPLGLVAGGMVDGTVGIWDPAKLAANHPQPRIAVVQRHTGPVNGLHFNPSPNSSHLLASGGADNEVFVMSLERPDAPNVFIPAPAPNTAKHTAEIQKVQWNPIVQHILATCSANGSTIVWDLRQKKPYCELRDPSRGLVADIAWDPSDPQYIATAAGDDTNPIVRVFDLRTSTSIPMAELKHAQGVLSISWCPFDPHLMLTTGKDGRTLLWDIPAQQPVYELAANVVAPDTGYGGFAGSQRRRYSATWSPALPALVGTCSFSRTVEFFNLAGVQCSNGQAPKWLRRPVSASVGWGGKLTTVTNRFVATRGGARRAPLAMRPVVHVTSMVEDPELVAASRQLEAALANRDLKGFCSSKAVAANSGDEKRVWAVLQTVVDKDSKNELNRFLGFDEAALPRAKTPLPPSRSAPPTPVGVAGTSDSFSSPAGGAQDATSLDGSAEGASAAEDLGTLVEGAASLSLVPPAITTAADGGRGDTSAEAEIKRALLAGGLERAVLACLDHDLVAEALLLSTAAGADLWSRTKDLYVAKQASRRPLLRIIDAIIKTDLSELVAKSDLANWQETLALINTYSKPADLAQLSEMLGTRLETEGGDRASATLCYLCALNVGKAVKFWVNALQSGKVDNHGSLALHSFVEKVSIILQASPDVQLTGDIAALFTKYAGLLAAQGELELAFRYAHAQDLATAVLRDRLYRASLRLQQTVQPPPFPFDSRSVGVATNPSPTRQKAAQPVMQQQQQQQQVHQQAQPQQHHQPKTLTPAQPAVTAAGPDPNALPAGWMQLSDPSSGRVYYANRDTGETTWDRPRVAPQPVVPPSPYGGTPAGGAIPGQPQAQMMQTQGPQAMAQQQQQQPASTTLRASKGIDYYSDGFTSSHGNQALIEKYGNQPHGAGAAVPQVATPGVAQPTTIFQPKPSVTSPVGSMLNNPSSAAPSVPSPVTAAPPSSSGVPPSAAKPTPTPVNPAELPPEVAPIIGGLNNLTQALQGSPSLGAGDKRQLGEVMKGVATLSQKLGAGEVPSTVVPRVLNLVEALQQRDFGTASTIQSEFAQTIWDQHKEWIKPLKALILLARK